MRIYTLTANPSVDIFFEVDRIVPEDIHRLPSIRKDAGGKGINVVRTLKTLHKEGVALGLAGGETGCWLEKRLAEEKIRHRFFRIAGASRTIYNIREKNTGRMFRFNETGPQVTRPDQKKFRNFLLSLPCRKNSFFAVCGTAPPSIPARFYAALLADLKKLGVKTVLDCDSPYLAEGIKAGPEIIKPNLFELSRLLDRKIETENDALQAARQLLGRGIRTVVVSLAEKGALAVSGRESFAARPPKVPERSSIGAGDAFLAGLLAELSEGKSLESALRLAVAAGSASVLYPGTAGAPLSRIREIHRKVKVESISQ